VHGKAQLCVISLAVTEFGTGFGVRRSADAARARREIGVPVAAIVRWQALVR
jgi:hypothetical protein